MHSQEIDNGLTFEYSDILKSRIAGLKDETINFMLMMYSVFSLVVLLIRGYYFLLYTNVGWDPPMTFFVTLYGAIQVITGLRKHLPYTIKLYSLLGFNLACGLFALLTWQLGGAGSLFLVLFCFYVALFTTARQGIYAALIVFLLFAVIGVLVVLEVVTFDENVISLAANSITKWISHAFIILVNVICLIYYIGRFNRLLKETMVSLTDQALALKTENSRRRETETALRDSESKYRVLFESAGDPILLVKDDIIVDCNHKACEFMEKKREEIIRHTIFEFAPAVMPDGTNLKQKIEEAIGRLKGLDSTRFEWTQKRRNGQELYVESSLTIMELNNTQYILAILRNVTERKIAEYNLLREKRLTESVINSLPGIFLMFDEGNNLIRWNQSLEQITGYTSAEIRKMKAVDWVDKTDRAYIEHKLHETIVDGSMESEFNIVHKNGSRIPFYITGVGVFINHRTYIICIGFDLSDRKAAEKALESSERRFRELVEIITVGICIVKGDLIVYLNRKQLEIFGTYPSSFKVADLPVYPEDLSTVLQRIEAVTSGEMRMFEEEIKVMHYSNKSGKKRPRLILCTGIRIHYMGETALLITMVDMTKTRELEDIVHVREKMASLGHVAAGIAHEIRNPLSGINILVDGILEDFENPDYAETVKRDISEIKKASNKISGVINRVLDFSRPGKHTLASADINAVIMDAVELSRVTLRKEGVLIETRLAVNLNAIDIDSQAMEQVFLNLISNAGTALKPIDGEKRIDIVSWREDDEVFVSVSDTGRGVSDDIMEKIFDPFFTTRSDGSGIGLSMCQRIITDHGGTIQVGKAECGGAEFKIKLPLKKEGLPYDE